MRNLILNRIEEIRNQSNGFQKGTMRWDNFSTGSKKHISEFDFNSCNEAELLSIFERLIKKYYTQM